MLNKHTPLVSIGCPVFNGEGKIESALDSIMSQDYNNLEIVISDNGSTDKTLEIVERYASSDKRIVVFSSKTNHGLRWNFERVLVESSGEYFMWLAHDDWIGPQFISLCVDQFCENTRLVLASTAAEIIGDSKWKRTIDAGLNTRNLESYVRVKNYVQTVDGIPNTNAIFCGVYRRDAICRLMPFPAVVGGDHVLLVRLALIGEFSCLAKPHLLKGRGGLSRTIKSQVDGLQLGSNIWYQLNLRFPYLCRQVFFHWAVSCNDDVRLKWKIHLHIFFLLHYFSNFVVEPAWLWVTGLYADVYTIYKIARGDKGVVFRPNVLPNWLKINLRK